jgi:hypothetical protein
MTELPRDGSPSNGAVPVRSNLNFWFASDLLGAAAHAEFTPRSGPETWVAPSDQTDSHDKPCRNGAADCSVTVSSFSTSRCVDVA